MRKIELAKWNQTNILDGELASADAITGSMRTTQNALSVWSIPNSTELEEAVLAIASGLQKPDTLDFLVIETALIESFGLKLDGSGPVRTPYNAFIPKHRDVINLNYGSLGTMAHIFIESIKRFQWVRFRNPEIRKILLDGIEAGKIKKEDLAPSLIEKLYPPPKAN